MFANAETSAGNNQQGGDFGITGGSRFNQPATQNSALPGGDLDDDAIISQADDDSGPSGNRDLFGTAMSFLKGGNANVESDIDEQQVQQAHQQAYG